MTSNYVIVSVKLYLNVGNNQYIILWNFGSRIMSGRSNQKKPGLGRVNATVHTPQSRLRAVSLFSWFIEQNARDAQMATCVTEGASACTPLTKSEEKERLLTVYPQPIYLNESVDELVTFQWRKQSKTLFVPVFLLVCHFSRLHPLLIRGGVKVRVPLPWRGRCCVQSCDSVAVFVWRC